jgi:DnaJ-class molecular chaperone
MTTCTPCDGSGWIDRPELYRRHGPTEDLDPPGVWAEECERCRGEGEVEDEEE